MHERGTPSNCQDQEDLFKRTGAGKLPGMDGSRPQMSQRVASCGGRGRVKGCACKSLVICGPHPAVVACEEARALLDRNNSGSRAGEGIRLRVLLVAVSVGASRAQLVYTTRPAAFQKGNGMRGMGTGTKRNRLGVGWHCAMGCN